MTLLTLKKLYVTWKRLCPEKGSKEQKHHSSEAASPDSMTIECDQSFPVGFKTAVLHSFMVVMASHSSIENKISRAFQVM